MPQALSTVLRLSTVALALCTGAAVAQDNCLKVMTFDWSATLITDPARIVNNSDLLHVNAAYEPLVVFDNNFSVSPWLAESFAQSADGLEWTFMLKDGITFQDGAPQTSADVVFTYRRLLDPATASPAASELGMITAEDISAPDARTVVFRTSEPVAQLPLLLATKYALIVREGSTAESLAKASNGTAPMLLPTSSDLPPGSSLAVM